MTESSKFNFAVVKGFPMMTELAEQELERRLSLYQVFLKLYEHNNNLLEDILQLEDKYQESYTGTKQLYLQGVINNSDIYVITNLSDCETRSLYQPQKIWTIGRDINNGVCILDKHLSRCHAAIQYIDNQGFYLIDLNSTNGCFVNGEQIYQPTELKDGDKVRLGTLCFIFFLNNSHQVLPNLGNEILLKVAKSSDYSEVKSISLANAVSSKACATIGQNNVSESIDSTVGFSGDYYPMQNLKPDTANNRDQLTLEEQSEILDSFFSRKIGDI